MVRLASSPRTTGQVLYSVWRRASEGDADLPRLWSETTIVIDQQLPPFVGFSLGRNGFSIDRIRADRILHEALTAGPDPLHLTLVFNIDHSTALRYATVAEHLLNDDLDFAPNK